LSDIAEKEWDGSERLESLEAGKSEQSPSGLLGQAEKGMTTAMGTPFAIAGLRSEADT
jgi:hypothetical protein